jgi:Peptidase family M1 domain
MAQVSSPPLFPHPVPMLPGPESPTLDKNNPQRVAAPGTALAMYRDLLDPAVNAADVYTIREVNIDREDLHLSFSDGTMGLMRTADGRVTGAIFEGTGEILLLPPNRAERTSLVLFTGSGVLEQQFNSAYMRFFDDKLVEELRAGFRPAEEAADFISRWQTTTKTLARVDALPVLRAITNAQDPSSRFLFVRLGGTQLGVFDVVFDANAPEQFRVAHGRIVNQQEYYDNWTSFPMRSVRGAGGDESGLAQFEIGDYKMRINVHLPSDVSAEAEFTLTPLHTGERTVILELSRYLRVTEVRSNGQPVEFIQNEAVSGSELARRGDDLVAVVFPSILEKGRAVKLSINYSGPVMFSAGEELLYVGFRGTWYPNAGPSYSNYDLTFEYPEDWSLVATGKSVSTSVENGRRISRFVTEKPIARAGFNLGKFETASVPAGGVAIHAYAGKTVEKPLAAREARTGLIPKPAHEVKKIADQAAASVEFLSHELDPFPYSNLEITQLPGLLSQSWPGLIYLSSLAYLDREERRAAGVQDAYTELLLSRLMLTHETAHQWWGDAVDPVSYRDEWIIEALANYCALLMLEKDDPQSMTTALGYYRSELLKETNNGIIAEAGPVTLGVRLSSSKFPEGYDRVLYGRGTWLIHMLRTMLRQAGGDKGDAAFFSALKQLLANSHNHKISTADLQHAFEQVLPASLNYEGSKSLDWFFDGWVNGNSVPALELVDVRLVPAADKIKASGTIRQSHGDKDLVTAVPLYAVDDAGKRSFLGFVFADEAATAFTLSAPAGTKQIVLDPENTVLRR